MPSFGQDWAVPESAAAELPKAKDTVFVLAQAGQMTTEKA